MYTFWSIFLDLASDLIESLTKISWRAELMLKNKMETNSRYVLLVLMRMKSVGKGTYPKLQRNSCESKAQAKVSTVKVEKKKKETSAQYCWSC